MASSAASELRSGEVFWVENQPFLLSVGYKLRPRYDPSWIPSWILDPKKNQSFCEDNLAPLRSVVMDAVCIRDGKKVVLKRVKTKSKELKMAQLLSSNTMRQDPRNRTIPIIDIITLPHEPKISLLVMMYGRRINYPPFHCRKEVFDAVRQLLQGMEFMHEHNIVHGDVATQNIIMDESRVVPNGSHFCKSRTHHGHSSLFSWRNRCSVSPVDYYYIDFELTTHYPIGNDHAEALGNYGSWRKPIPELSASVPYNPFKVDICRLGLTIRDIIKPYPALEIMMPLTDNMCHSDPSLRPSAREVLSQLGALEADVEPKLMRQPIWQIQATSFHKLCRRLLGAYWMDYESPR
ncbi:hypothetical protein C8R43DRAFT_874124 [Mycena crocata]|nr:hypothetical protein C8R43DRAFT_874124 [Mycena crocata]